MSLRGLLGILFLAHLLIILIINLKKTVELVRYPQQSSFATLINWGCRQNFDLFNMRMKGLEPSHLAVLEPKSSASANSATSAFVALETIAQKILSFHYWAKTFLLWIYFGSEMASADSSLFLVLRT